MMIHRNKSDEDTDFFNIVAEVLQGDTIFSYNLPRLHTLNVDRSNKRKLFYVKRKTSR